MVITTILSYVVARTCGAGAAWRPARYARSSSSVDLAFFGANVLKILHGGWVPLVIAAFVFTADDDVEARAAILGEPLPSARTRSSSSSRTSAHAALRVPGTAVFMTGSGAGTPPALLHNLKHNKVLHEQVVLLTVVTDGRAARAGGRARVEVERSATASTA